MKWIKASEKLPAFYQQIFFKYVEVDGTDFIHTGQLLDLQPTELVFKTDRAGEYYDQEDFEHIYWLDENPSDIQSNNITNEEKAKMIANQCKPCSDEFYTGIYQGVLLTLRAEQNKN